MQSLSNGTPQLHRHVLAASSALSIVVGSNGKAYIWVR